MEKDTILIFKGSNSSLEETRKEFKALYIFLHEIAKATSVTIRWLSSPEDLGDNNKYCHCKLYLEKENLKISKCSDAYFKNNYSKGNDIIELEKLKNE